MNTKTIIVCDVSGTVASTVCPEGTMLKAEVLALNPTGPTPEQVEMGSWAFALVVVVYVLSSGVGALVRLFKE